MKSTVNQNNTFSLPDNIINLVIKCNLYNSYIIINMYSYVIL